MDRQRYNTLESWRTQVGRGDQNDMGQVRPPSLVFTSKNSYDINKKETSFSRGVNNDLLLIFWVWIHNFADLSKHERTYEIRSNTTKSCNVMHFHWNTPGWKEGTASLHCCKPTFPQRPKNPYPTPFLSTSLIGIMGIRARTPSFSHSRYTKSQTRIIRWCLMIFLNPTSWCFRAMVQTVNDTSRDV